MAQEGSETQAMGQSLDMDHTPELIHLGRSPSGHLLKYS